MPVEYFGFLRRDPDDTPDTDMSGFDCRLQKMDWFTLTGEEARSERGTFERFKRAKMVKAFILTDGCRHRFGQ